jgi:hypothetical protein
MKRGFILLASALLALSSGSTAFAATKHPLKDVSVPGGIGATRASFDLTYGAPTADIFGSIEKQLHTDDANYAVPKSQGMTIDVEFVVNKDNKERGSDRAFDIIVSAPDGKSWSLVDANIVVDLLLPKDAKATSDLAPVAGVATASYDWEEQTFTSAFVAKVIPGKNWYLNEQVGLITVSLQPDAPGVYTQINVGTDVN